MEKFNAILMENFGGTIIVLIVLVVGVVLVLNWLHKRSIKRLMRREWRLMYSTIESKVDEVVEEACVNFVTLDEVQERFKHYTPRKSLKKRYATKVELRTMIAEAVEDLVNLHEVQEHINKHYSARKAISKKYVTQKALEALLSDYVASDDLAREIEEMVALALQALTDEEEEPRDKPTLIREEPESPTLIGDGSERKTRRIRQRENTTIIRTKRPDEGSSPPPLPDEEDPALTVCSGPSRTTNWPHTKRQTSK